jgi:hypothetical protein
MMKKTVGWLSSTPSVDKEPGYNLALGAAIEKRTAVPTSPLASKDRPVVGRVLVPDHRGIWTVESGP